MSLTVKLLDHPSFFLLTFEPLSPAATPDLPPLKPFRILLDPRLNDDAAREALFPPPCIMSLLDLPEIDLVILTHPSSDTTHERSLRDLPPHNSALRTSPLVLAEHRAANILRGWDHFHQDRIRITPPWRDPGLTSRDGVSRVQIPPFLPGGQPGELTVALVPFEKADKKRTKRPAAVGITYRPPPPGTPLRSPRARNGGAALSVIFCPRGASYTSLSSYATGHLVAEAALPLTCLLHPFDEVDVPWWCPWTDLRRTGAPEGCEAAATLGARGWLWGQSVPLEFKGLKRRMVKSRQWWKKEVVVALEKVVQGKGKGRKTSVKRMRIGDEVVLTQEGVWRTNKGVRSDVSSRKSDVREGQDAIPDTIAEEEGEEEAAAGKEEGEDAVVAGKGGDEEVTARGQDKAPDCIGQPGRDEH